MTETPNPPKIPKSPNPPKLLLPGRRPGQATTGRRGILNDDMIEALAVQMRKGLYAIHACAIVGVSEDSYWNWMKRGGDADETDLVFLRFAEAMKKAQADSIEERLSRIDAAGEGGAVTSRTTKTTTHKNGNVVVEETEKLSGPAWQADAWSTERRNRELYGQPRSVAEVAAGVAMLLFARVEFVDCQDGVALDEMKVAEIGQGDGKT
ncbi:hypothetical protein LCGC14_0824960 [marine sediment metagenome]|uniref:Uncharacterized protein n=1 Tax=marine sediment metagenome TaxID=412755 RepID=A0A0F9S2K2_9ZZZZ